MKPFKQLKEELSKESDTIVVDGVTRSRLNSNGKPIYPTEEGIINFWKWFGNSQVVDKNNSPLKMYHGTVTWERKDGRQLGDIHSFNRKASVDIVRRPPSADTVGIWFSNKVQGGADQYGDTFYPVYLKVMDAKRTTFDGMLGQAYEEDKGFRPTDIHDKRYMPDSMEPYRAWLKSEGYDGLNMIHDPSNRNSNEFQNQVVYVVLEPNQIKSAIGNNGSFDGSSDKIVEAEQQDMFQSDFANKRSTVKKSKVVSSKGATEVQTFKNVNSNGQMIALTKQSLDNFWNWFDGSKAVDDKGRPKVFYHGTRTDVSKFKSGIPSKNTGLFGFEYDAVRHAVFFSPSPDFANSFAQISGEGSNVIPVYLYMNDVCDLRKGVSEEIESRLERAGYNVRMFGAVQYTWELFDEEFNGKHFTECLKSAGYDSVIFNEEDDNGNTVPTFAVFESNQVKSAIGNVGSFNVDSPNITEEVSKKPLYVHRPLLNPQPLIQWAHEQGFTKTLSPDDFHVTIVYSKKPVEWNKFTPDTKQFKNTNDDRAMDKFGDAVVLKFVSPTLNKRHFQFKEGGASWDYPNYQPHVTITYDGGDVDVKALQPYEGVLAFGAEEFEDLDEDWSESIDEKQLTTTK